MKKEGKKGGGVVKEREKERERKKERGKEREDSCDLARYLYRLRMASFSFPISPPPIK